MTKNLLQQIMIREVETPAQLDAKELVKIIEAGYLVGREPKHTQKKTHISAIVIKLRNIRNTLIILRIIDENTNAYAK